MEQSYRPDKDVRDAVVVWSGTTTSAGDAGGTYLVDSGLTQGNTYWVNMVVLIRSGNSNGQARRISVFTAGTVTVDTAFASQIALGTKYDILGQHATTGGGGGDATLANQLLMLGDIGTASASTLGSLYGILGNPAQSFLTMVGYEGTSSLAAKLTAARAGYLDNINQAGLLQITAARGGYLDNINQAGLLQVTATRAGYLDNINNANLSTIANISTLNTTNIGYLANINQAGLLQVTAARAGYLDNINNVNLGTLPAITAARIGYLDNINQAGLLQVTAARAGYLDDINNAQLLNVPDLSTLTAARIGYLDNINQAGLLQVTATRAGYLDNINNTNLSTIANISTLNATNIGYLTNINNVNLGTLPAITAARVGYLDNINQAGLLQVTATRAGYLDNIAATAVGKTQVLEVAITSAANIGNVTVATVTTQACIIDSIIIHANAAQTANMTTCAVTGGASSVITFISTNDATQANLNATDKQIAWDGAVRLTATKTIVISLVGTGATAVNLTISITYHAAVSGGYLT